MATQAGRSIEIQVTGISVAKHVAVVHAAAAEDFRIPVSRAVAEQLMNHVCGPRVWMRLVLQPAARPAPKNPGLRLLKLDYRGGYATATGYTSVGDIQFYIPLSPSDARQAEELLSCDVECVVVDVKRIG